MPDIKIAGVPESNGQLKLLMSPYAWTLEENTDFAHGSKEYPIPRVTAQCIALLRLIRQGSR